MDTVLLATLETRPSTNANGAGRLLLLDGLAKFGRVVTDVTQVPPALVESDAALDRDFALGRPGSRSDINL